jgi:sporulation integral membrane protein YlbJ
MPTFSYIKTALLALFSLFLVLSIVSFPKQAYESSLRGLTIWWDVVFPALLPFFITAELLIGFGVVHFLGILLEPLMRPLFRVPGVGGFVMSMGIASGYPMGAKLTVRLRDQGIITRSEGERLVSITSTSGPLFMFGAVAVGFFHDVTLGIIIATAHYIAAFQVGLFMRFHDVNGEATPHTSLSRRSLFYRALQAMHRARIRDGRTFGTLMGEAVMSSVQTLLMIGGFIIIFSVIINIMNLVGVSTLLALLFSIILIPFGVSTDFSLPLIAGFFEITLGAQMTSGTDESLPLVHKVAIAGAIIAWSGLSVHAQVASMLAKTDIRYTPYVFARLIHAFLAAIWTFILWNPMQRFITPLSSPVFLSYVQRDWSAVWSRFTYFSYSLILLCIILLLISFFLKWAKQRSGKHF